MEMSTRGLCTSFTPLRLTSSGAARPVILCPLPRVAAEGEGIFVAASSLRVSFRKAETPVPRGNHDRGAWATYSTSADHSVAFTEDSVVEARGSPGTVTVAESVLTGGEAVEEAAVTVVDVSSLSAKERRKLRQDARRRNMVSQTC